VGGEIDHWVLILDDQPHITFILKKFLEKKYKVLTATSIKESDSILADENKEISVAFIDYNLKDVMDGIDYAKELKDNYPLIQAIMITGASSYDIALKALNSGAIDAFINKPFAFNEIQKTLDENLEKWFENHKLVNELVTQLIDTGTLDDSKLDSTSLSDPKIRKIVEIESTKRVKSKFDLLGFGITKGDKILMKYFFDKTIQAKYTPLFAKFIQTLSVLNLDIFAEADSHKLEELTLEDISILFRSVDTINYSIFVKGEPTDKDQLVNQINKITSQFSLYSAQSKEAITKPVKDLMINHFKEFKESFTYQ
jgi:CheY-like chemotaxis protein